MHLLAGLVWAHASLVSVPVSQHPDTARDRPLLRVLAINDFHGALEPQVWPWSGGRAVGGAVALKSWLDSLTRTCGCATIRLDAGDEMQGTLISNYSFGRPAIAAMNAFGIDAAAIGNHEFDWSVDTLRARMAGAHYRFLAANISDSATTVTPAWAEPWTVIERGRVRVAVIGLALPETPVNTAPRNVRGLAFGDGAAAVRRVLPRARAGADYVIVVAHEGAFCDAACHGEIVDLARGLDSGSVDLIVSGHTHSLVNTVVNGIPIVQARSSGAGIAVVDFLRGRQVLARPDGRADAHVAGLEAWYDPARPAGRRITRLRLADGAAVDDAHTYTLAVSDFLAAGGSGYAMLRNARQDDVGMTDLDALVQYLGDLRQPIAAPTDARLHR